jgi:hypothetical protein
MDAQGMETPQTPQGGRHRSVLGVRNGWNLMFTSFVTLIVTNGGRSGGIL